MRKNLTSKNEHELAAWFDVAPVFIVSWIEAEMLEAERDELGYTIGNEKAEEFETERESLIDGARIVTATVKKMGVARATLRREQGRERPSLSEDDGA